MLPSGSNNRPRAEMREKPERCYRQLRPNVTSGSPIHRRRPRRTRRPTSAEAGACDWARPETAFLRARMLPWPD
jgi:hypothetical protein